MEENKKVDAGVETVKADTTSTKKKVEVKKFETKNESKFWVGFLWAFFLSYYYAKNIIDRKYADIQTSEHQTASKGVMIGAICGSIFYAALAFILVFTIFPSVYGF